MEKKGVEMSLNVIIVAAIGLLILLILAFLVVRNVAKVPDAQAKDCGTNGGLCSATQCESVDKQVTPSNCGGSKPYCCKIV